MHSYAANLDVRGLPDVDKKKLLKKLKPRLDYIKGREPSSWRADDAAFFLQRLLIRSGHPEATVEWKIPQINPEIPANTIQLNAAAGPKYYFGNIYSKELPMTSNEELKQYFLQPLVETELVYIDESPYIQDYLEPGVNNVKNRFKSLGYWNTTVSIESEKVRTELKQIDILLSITPGNLLSIAPPTYSGASEENIRIYHDKISPYINRKATTENISKIRNIVNTFYRENGYQLAKIELITEKKDKVIELHFKINPGKQYNVRKIIVKGHDSSKRRRISRYFKSQKGERFNQNKTNEIIAKLISTGAFSSVTADPVPVNDGETSELDIHLQVKEADAKSFSSYAGFGNFEGFIFGSGYIDHNYHGSLRKLYLGGEFSGRGFLGEVGTIEPNFLTGGLKLDAKVFGTQRDYEGYDINQFGFETLFTWSPSRTYSTSLLANVTYANSSTTALTDTELGADDYLHTYASLSHTIDLRDSSILPKHGFYAKALIQGGFITGDSDNSYTLASFNGSYRYLLNPKSRLQTRFQISALNPESDNLPIDIRLFGGGVHSQRAYEDRELGPQSASSDSLGGEAFWAASVEYIYNFRDPIKLSTFFDAGQIYSDVSDLDFRDASYALGLGARIELPIGPVRLEYGYNLNRRPGEPQGTIQFSIGSSF